MEKITYCGFIEERDLGEHDSFLFLSGSDDPLAETLEWMTNKQVCVRYWITDRQMTPEDAQEEFSKLVIGAADVKFIVHYGEMTGYLWTDEDLNVGGHDLLAELKSCIGKWLILEVEWF